VERGRIIDTTPDVVLCLWENWEIFDSILGKKWKIVKERDGFYRFKDPNSPIAGRMQHVATQATEQTGTVKYLISIERLGFNLQALITLTYARTTDDRTSVEGTVDVEVPLLMILVAKLLEKRVQRIADEVISDGDTSCVAVSKNAAEYLRLPPNHIQTVESYRDKWPRKHQPSQVSPVLPLMKLLMQTDQDGFNVIYEHSEYPNPIGPFHKALNKELLQYFTQKLNTRLIYDMCKFHSYLNRNVNRISTLSGDSDVPDLEQIGRGLFAAVVPKDVADSLRAAQGYLLISTDDLTVPWELMHTGRDFLSTQFSLGRAIIKPYFPPKPAPASPAKKRPKMLLLGDPLGDSKEWALPEAREEIETLIRNLEALKLSESLDVDVFVGKQITPEKLSLLLAQSYDMIHYSGHAGFSKERKESYLLVNNGSDQPVKFGAHEIYNLLTGSPVVFMNGCETGAHEQRGAEKTEFVVTPGVEGLASAFTSGGARGYVGTMWPVFDDFAKKVANGFYSKLCAGETVGDSLRYARSRVNAPDQPLTWAAYVLFGHPDARLNA